jgi:hypothetical protein
MVSLNNSRFQLSQLISLGLFLLFVAQPAIGQTVKVYRGSLGDKHIEMKLKIEASQVSGTYFYDQFKQDLQLKGTYAAEGRLELTETGPKGKPTGKFACKKAVEPLDIDLDCEWSRPDGTGKIPALLIEQFVDFRKGLQLVPKTTITRPLNLSASYPQLAGNTSSSITAFNTRMESLAQESVKAYAKDPNPGGSFDLNYNIMLGTDELVSIELNEEICCGAHPTESANTLTYDLVANKEVSLVEIFKTGADYKEAIASFVVSDINRRAEQIEQAEATREGRKVEKGQEPFMTADSLPKMSTWAITPKGIAVYFDFPHAMAVFTRTIVPFNVLRDQLKPDGAAARFLH